MESILMWTVTLLGVAAIFFGYVAKFRRRQSQTKMDHDEAVALGVDRPPTQHPIVDEVACIGCGACVDACPEGDVLGVVSGRAVIINGMRCVGHGRCEEVCPVSAIKVGLGDISQRDDIPRLSEHNESSVPGLYIAGELSGFALIRNAVDQGRKVVEHIGSKPRVSLSGGPDLIVVGAGPAGMAAALTAKKLGLSCLVLDQQTPGGTILQYPRRKLVLTQPVDIPLYGWLRSSEYAKEDLLAIWESLPSTFDLDVRVGMRVESVDVSGSTFHVVCENGTFTAANVVLALGRRGTPRKLGALGEDQPKVMYQLADAGSYRDQRILVVGGGDSAVEAAMGLARQRGNVVTLSYRRPKLVRIRQKNAERIQPLFDNGTISALFESDVEVIGKDTVRIRTKDGPQDLANDYVFVFAGGEPPFDLLRAAGVEFGGDGRRSVSEASRPA